MFYYATLDYFFLINYCILVLAHIYLYSLFTITHVKVMQSVYLSYLWNLPYNLRILSSDLTPAIRVRRMAVQVSVAPFVTSKKAKLSTPCFVICRVSWGHVFLKHRSCDAHFLIKLTHTLNFCLKNMRLEVTFPYWSYDSYCCSGRL